MGIALSWVPVSNPERQIIRMTRTNLSSRLGLLGATWEGVLCYKWGSVQSDFDQEYGFLFGPLGFGLRTQLNVLWSNSKQFLISFLREQK